MSKTITKQCPPCFLTRFILFDALLIASMVALPLRKLRSLPTPFSSRSQFIASWFEDSRYSGFSVDFWQNFLIQLFIQYFDLYFSSFSSSDCTPANGNSSIIDSLRFSLLLTTSAGILIILAVFPVKLQTNTVDL